MQERQIREFFRGLSGRVAFLKTLHDNGREDEAFLLACCYIDGIAAWWRGGGASGKKFADVLAKFGGEPVLDKRKAEGLYKHFRHRHVHQLGRYYEDEYWGLLRIHYIDFDVLHRALTRIVDAAMRESISKLLLFGRKLTYE